METKPLLYGIIGFIIGGLLVSVAATTFDKPKDMGGATMVSSLEGKQGDAFDAAFINSMIDHHQDAIDMAKLSEKQARHPEIKQLSRDIINAQQKEINNMKRWQSQWGYAQDDGQDGM